MEFIKEQSSTAAGEWLVKNTNVDIEDVTGLAPNLASKSLNPAILSQ
jgi:hypothetical protein